MAQTVRQNFIIPKSTKKLLDELVPKGERSAFVAETLEARLRSKKSWEILNIPPRLDIKDPVRYAKKLREGWDRHIHP